jgi:UDP-glucose 4-epimerase
MELCVTKRASNGNFGGSCTGDLKHRRFLSLHMRNIFISGGAGFIGSHLARRLLGLADVATVTIYDNFSSGTRGHLEAAATDRRLRVVEGDIKDLPKITSAMAGSDTVFHLAANPDIAKAVTQPDIDFWEGTYLAQNVLEAMRVNKVPRLLYTSGSGVYGENAAVAFRENYGPCLPISTYGASKLACEALICAYCHMFGLTARAFRFANVVGILGDGSQSKSYIHVDDILDAVLLANERCTANYDMFNVATDDYITVKQIADLAVQVSELGAAEVKYEFTGGDRGWKGDVPIVRFDCAKIKALGWKCRRTSAEAVRDAMSAMREEITHA